MPTLLSVDNAKTGVPLGGIGAGKIEILPNGLFNAFTIQNNWSKPLNGSGDFPGILGFHLGIRAESTPPPFRSPSGDRLPKAIVRKGGRVKAFLLQTVPILKIPAVRRIRYEGSFPGAVIHYEEPALGLSVALRAEGVWLPQDVKHSSLPASFFALTIKNIRRVPVRAAFLFIGRNLSGKWCIGRRNRVTDEKDVVHLEFLNEDPSSRDVRQGTLRFSFVKKGWETSFLESWNAVSKNFIFNTQNISLEGWEIFEEKGTLPNAYSHHTVHGENQELCGAVSAARELLPGETAELSFVASWFFPHHPLGHRYEKWFRSASDVARYAISRRTFFRRAQERVERLVKRLPFPAWFNDALLSNLAPFAASTWFVKDGRFSIYEAPVICPLMGTLDVGFYGSIPLSYFFPELEKSLITQFARAQRLDGYVPHDLGKNRLDMPSDGTTFYRWKDLNPKFILMIYRDYLWSGDRAFFKRMYPHVKKALAWSLAQDHDHNGLPDNEGADQTFDLWNFYGTSAYTSSIFLAALLACQRMARVAKDEKFLQETRACYAKGRLSFEHELWNGRSFGEPCALSQLNGQWYANLLDLGPIVDRAKTRRALETILHLASRPSRFGLVNAVWTDGRVDLSNEHSKNIWSGMNYAFIALCLSEGFSLERLLKEVRKLWDNVTQIQKNVWSQPDTIDAVTGRYVFGDSYYRNMAIWSIPLMHAKKDRETARILRELRFSGFSRSTA